MDNKMNSIYETCPVLENNSFRIRLVEEKDAIDLHETYSDKNALPFFNSDNCNGDNFYCETAESMLEAIKYWLWEYERKGFVRFAIIDKENNQAIGTIELFNRRAEDFFNNCGILRLDVKSNYENRNTLNEILSLIVKPAYDLFDCTMFATKGPIYAIERTHALKSFGFEKAEQYLVGQHDNRRYYDYWIIKK